MQYKDVIRIELVLYNFILSNQFTVYPMIQNGFSKKRVQLNFHFFE